MRYTYLDALRGVAALGVVFFHYRGFVPDTLPGEAWLWPGYWFGGYAVQLFWLLSGIVFMATYGSHSVSGREFFIRRFARLYPLHFATLLMMLALDLTNRALKGAPLLPANDVTHFALQLFMASNWLGETPHSFDVPVWSVSMEIIAYATFLLVMRVGWLKFWRCIVIASAACLIALLTGHYTASCVGLFFLGTVLQQLPARLGRFHAPAALAVLAAAVGLAFLVGSSAMSRHVGLIICYAVFPAFLLSVLALDLHVPPVPRRLWWLGESTYAIYLLHIPLLTATLLVLGAPACSRLASHGWFLALFVVGLVSLSTLMYRFFERPLQSAILLRFGATGHARQHGQLLMPPHTAA